MTEERINTKENVNCNGKRVVYESKFNGWKIELVLTKETERDLSSLSVSEVQLVLEHLGIDIPADIVVNNKINGELLNVVDDISELTDLGVHLSSIKSKLLMKKIRIFQTDGVSQQLLNPLNSSAVVSPNEPPMVTSSVRLETECPGAVSTSGDEPSPSLQSATTEEGYDALSEEMSCTPLSASAASSQASIGETVVEHSGGIASAASAASVEAESPTAPPEPVQGTITYPNGDVYKGELVRSQRHGQGKLTSTDGAVYEGEWQRDKQHGNGTHTAANRSVYNGSFFEGVRCGYGTLTNSDGSSYRGEWRGNCLEGQGVYQFANKSVYEGQFVHSAMCGMGKMTYVAGAMLTYEGEWKDNRRNGQGVLRYVNGDVYEGTFANTKNGYGVTKYASGGSHLGEWRDDKKHGLGVLTLANGDSYEGMFESNQMCGQGVMKYANGDWYQGCWKADKWDGRGVLHYGNGSWFDGEFKAGALYVGSVFDARGNLQVTYALGESA